MVFVILNVATHPNLKGNSFYGLAIGLTVMAGLIVEGDGDDDDHGGGDPPDDGDDENDAATTTTPKKRKKRCENHAKQCENAVQNGPNNPKTIWKRPESDPKNIRQISCLKR